jgi:hypothetical protein
MIALQLRSHQDKAVLASISAAGSTGCAGHHGLISQHLRRRADVSETSLKVVIEQLQARCFEVVAIANPLRSVAGAAAHERDVNAGIG